MLSKKEKESLGIIFKLLDSNGDGKLSKDEVKLGYEKHFDSSLTDEQIE